MATACILKISVGGDIRRLRTSLPTFEFVGRAVWLRALRETVHHQLSATPDTIITEDWLTLKYKAENEKICLVSEDTAADLIARAVADKSGTLLLRLFVEVAAPSTSCLPKAPTTTGMVVLEDTRVSAVAMPNASLPAAQRRVAVAAAVAAQRRVRAANAVTPKQQAAQPLWTSQDGKASIAFAETRYGSRQPRLDVGKYAFLVRIKLAPGVEETAFDSSAEHAAVVDAALSAVRQLAPKMARTPGWHSVTLEDGCSVALQLCLDYQLHLCLKHCLPPTQT